ncbi:hypothetical protein AB0G76_37920, partial [Streptomyces asoensis]|uniref:hypothetical protein n=1 Tax=Streptomyces asoensis TaxID=249586 RepID=UPI0034118E27
MPIPAPRRRRARLRAGAIARGGGRHGGRLPRPEAARRGPEALADIEPRAAEVPFYSTVLGSVIDTGDLDA